MALFSTIPCEQHQRGLSMSHLLAGDNQQLRLKLTDEEFLSPLIPYRVRRHSISNPYARNVYSRERTGLTAHEKSFHVSVDVQQFTPEEISVKCVNEDTIVVECQHVEKPDEHGYISRHFVRKYKVPNGHDIHKCMSKLSSDGVLTVIVPKTEKHHKDEIDVPIIFMDQPVHVHHRNIHDVPIKVAVVTHCKDPQTAPSKKSPSSKGKSSLAPQNRIGETVVASHVKDNVKKNGENEKD